MRTRRRTNEKGFTLIELMASLVILALLLVIAVPAVGAVVKQAEMRTLSASAALIEDAAELALIADVPLDDIIHVRYKVSTLVDTGFVKTGEISSIDVDTAYVEQDVQGVFRLFGVDRLPVPEVDVPTDEDVDDDNPQEPAPGTDVPEPPVVTEPEIPTPVEPDIPVELEPETPDVPVVDYPEPAPTPESEFRYDFSGVNGGARVTNYVGKKKAIVIPPTLGGKPVTEIAKSALSEKAFTSVHIPNTVVVIRAWSFATNNLTDVVIPPSVRTIEESAFRNNKLSTFVMYEGIEYMGQFAIGSTNMTEVVIPKSMQWMDRMAMQNVLWTDITVLNPNMKFGDDLGASVFWNIGMTYKPKFVLHGYTGSTTDTHAKTFGFMFEPLD